MSIMSIFKKKPVSEMNVSDHESIVAKREVFKPYNFIPAESFPGCEALYEDVNDFLMHVSYDGHNEDEYAKDACVDEWTHDNEYYNFTQEAETVYAPFLAKALVVALARKNGIPVRVLGNTYDNSDTILPMKGAYSIPSGYGSMSREIIIFTDFVNIAPFATSGDNRHGWEYGHSTAIFIGSFGDKGLNIRTNQNEIYSSEDIETFLCKNSLRSIVHKLGLDSDRLNITVAA